MILIGSSSGMSLGSPDPTDTEGFFLTIINHYNGKNKGLIISQAGHHIV